MRFYNNFKVPKKHFYEDYNILFKFHPCYKLSDHFMGTKISLEVHV